MAKGRGETSLNVAVQYCHPHILPGRSTLLLLSPTSFYWDSAHFIYGKQPQHNTTHSFLWKGFLRTSPLHKKMQFKHTGGNLNLWSSVEAYGSDAQKNSVSFKITPKILYSGGCLHELFNVNLHVKLLSSTLLQFYLERVIFIVCIYFNASFLQMML